MKLPDLTQLFPEGRPIGNTNLYCSRCGKDLNGEDKYDNDGDMVCEKCLIKEHAGDHPDIICCSCGDYISDKYYSNYHNEPICKMCLLLNNRKKEI